ncbi:MAG: putative signal transduction histidine kinase [Mucilaginibacter sp.]|nr:putative signal transduction histidine kinase [Mucilaginibacter sp.]
MNKKTLKPWVYNVIPLFIWFLLLILPFISAPFASPKSDHHRILIHILISNILLLVVFYLHTYLIYPLLKQKGLLWYIPGVLMLFLLHWLSGFFLRSGYLHIFGSFPRPGFGADSRRPNTMFGPPLGGPGIFILSPLIAILCSFCYRIIIDNAAREQLLQDRETVHLRTELNFLRSQINPHFLFNILNSLTALARKKSDVLEPAIINLSQLMRYMLYESDDNKVPLKKELEYLTSYIDLQLLRFGKDVTVKTNFTGNYEDCQIDPMLFIPIVENAFKHGTDIDNHNVILINLKVSENCNILHFKLVNYFDKADKINDTNTGIGLKNIQRRLDILYPHKHKFNTFSVGDTYTTELSIDLT